MITLSSVDKVYQTDKIETTALQNINISVSRGEFVSVMGPSGCGKSTLLNIMGLLDKPSKGQVSIDDTSVGDMRDRHLAQLRNKSIGFVFQSYHLINDLSVRDNVELPLLYRHTTGRKRRETALQALEKVGLSTRVKHFPNQLSGGQCQRVAIARAIVGQPEIILADEPTGNLDSSMGADIMQILQTLNEQDRTTIVMVTHDEHLAHQTGRIIRLFDGSQVS